MLGFVFALLTAFLEATKDALSKKKLEQMDEYLVAFWLRALQLPFLLPLLLFFPIPPLDETFFMTLIVAGLIHAFIAVVYVKAIKMSPLSLSLPMLTFTPLFLLVTSPIMVGEFPTAAGVIGIVLIVLGAYTLHIKEMKEGVLSPFRKIVREKGAMLMLFVAAVWAITSNLDKIGINHSNAVFWAIAFHMCVSTIMLPFVLYKTGRKIRQVFGSAGEGKSTFTYLGLVPAVRTLFQNLAFSMAIVPYVIAIKRTSSIFGVLYGHFVFKEKDVRQRLLGAAIMIAGVILIAFF